MLYMFVLGSTNVSILANGVCYMEFLLVETNSGNNTMKFILFVIPSFLKLC